MRGRLSKSHSALTFFTLPSNYSVILHNEIFDLLYYSNGGFSWSDVYNMPVKFRKFYFNKLLDTKKTESESIKTIKTNSKTSKRR